MSVLGLEGVTKVYGQGPAQVQVLHGVDLEVEEGEYVAVVGPSGSGKSTLLNLMGALDRPSGGSVSLVGEDLASYSDARISKLRAAHLGFVFQQFFLIDGRRAIDNVADGLLYQGVPRKARLERAAEALERVGLGHRLDHKPNQLSGGECQRVAIARALVHEPKLLLADEPTGNLDSVSGATVLELFDQLNGDGATIVLVTHDRKIADRTPRVISVSDGRIHSDTRVAVPV